MVSRGCGSVVAFLLVLPVSGPLLGAQSSSSQPGYVFHAQAREVLLDVTVEDAHGNPVQGLPQSAFQVLDNGHAQRIASFHEHTRSGAEVVAAAETRPGVYSNGYLQHAPAVSNVILLDTTTIPIVPQMILYQQLKRLVNVLPADEPVAVYARTGDFAVLLQNFTADHALLLAAIQKAIPHLRGSGSWRESDFDAMQQMTVYLSQIPGRKNLLWFSGGSNQFLRSDPTQFSAGIDLRPLYDALEAARIALYPVDARGLTVNSPGGMVMQHLRMGDEARATGGRAYFKTNGLAEAAQQVLATSTDFYTLTYAPDDIQRNNRWHKVKIKVAGGAYRLSYRRGYYDDGSNPAQAAGGTRTVLQVNGDQERVADLREEPILFEARVVPEGEMTGPGLNTIAKPKRGEMVYAIHYTLPVDAFRSDRSGGNQSYTIGTAVLAFNRYGNVAGREMGKVTAQRSASLTPELLATPLEFNQFINLPKGQDFLYVVVWDMATGRLGTIQVPLAVGGS